MKHILILFFAIATMACTSTNAEVKQAAEPSQTIQHLDSNSPGTILQDTLLLPIAHNEGIDVLLPGMYRGTEPSDYAHMLDEEWYELYRDPKTNLYYLVKADIEIGQFEDECIGELTTYVSAKRDSTQTSLPENHSILFIKGLKPWSTSFESAAIEQGADGRMAFTFNNTEYYFTATDSRLCEGMYGEDVCNYRLWLTVGTGDKRMEQLLVAIPNLRGVNVTILFVGDLDGDGKPDFVIDNARDYEESRAVLFLSSKAKKGEIVRCVGESSFQGDC